MRFMQTIGDAGEEGLVVVPQTDDSCARGADLGDVDVGAGVAVECR